MSKAGCPVPQPVARAQRPPAGRLGTLAACAAVTLALPSPGGARAEIVPIVLSQYEHSSDKATASGNTFRSDLYRLSAGFESDFQVGRQDLYLDASYGKVSYGDITAFSDDEWDLRAGMKWLVGPYFDGRLEATDDKQVPSTPDILINGNSIEEERRLTAEVNAELAEWLRLETSVVSRSLDTPIVEIADFGLRENIQRVALKYLTTARLSYGAEYESTDGKFRNAPELATYTQRTPAVTLQYSVPDLDALAVKLGRTERKQSGEPEPFTETTGNIWLQRELTGKTAINLLVYRSIDNYFGPDAGAFALATNWTAGVNWKATGKSTIRVDYGETRTDFLGDGIAGQVVAGRKDRSSTINLNLTTEALSWLTTELYLRFDNVDSNFPINSYDGVLAGIRLKARLMEPRH